MEQLSAEAAELESQAGTGTGTTFQAKTKSKRVEIDYAIDRTSYRIRITSVRQGVGCHPTGDNHG